MKRKFETTLLIKSKEDVEKDALDETATSLLKKDVLTAIPKAIAYNSIPLLRRVMSKGAPINTPDTLKVAVETNLAMVQFLVSRGLDVKRYTGDSSVISAIEHGNYDIADYLLEKGLSANASRDDETALYAACLQLNPEMVESLLKNGANKYWRDSQGYTALSHTIRRCFALIRRQYPKDYNNALMCISALLKGGYDFKNDLAMTSAARYGLLHIVQILRDAGADINESMYVQIMHGKRNPLELAVEEGHLEVVKFLISKGADVNAIEMRKSFTYMECVEFLVKKGADLNKETFGHIVPDVLEECRPDKI